MATWGQFHQYFFRGFYVWRLQIPKAQKKTDSLTVFFALMESARVKAACKTVERLTAGRCPKRAGHNVDWTLHHGEADRASEQGLLQQMFNNFLAQLSFIYPWKNTYIMAVLFITSLQKLTKPNLTLPNPYWILNLGKHWPMAYTQKDHNLRQTK